MYCEIVLQGRLKGKKIVLQYSHCIAEKEAWRVGFELQYTGVYCNRGSWVRLGICIAIQNLYCDCGARARMDCIAIQWPAKPRYSRGWAVGALGAQAGAGALGWACVGRWAGCAWGAGLGVEGVAHNRQGAWQGRAAGRARGRGARGRQVQAGGRRAGSAGHARPGRWARGLGARAGLGLCTRCTRPVFGPVRLGIFLSQIFWTLFMNPVHEHCSYRNFSKKQNILNLIKNQIKSNKF